MEESKLREKSYKFAIRIVNLYKYLVDVKREFVISKQVLRAGTSIGAMIREAEFAQSKADFISKMSIALKESNETNYWLLLLNATQFISEGMHSSIGNDCHEIVRMLVATVKTSKRNC